MQSKQGSGLPSGLIEAYEKTRYTVDDSKVGKFVIEVTKVSEQLGVLQRSYASGSASTSAAFITAFNPYGELLTDVENQARHSLLVDACSQKGWSYYEGYGAGEDEAAWEPERSLLVVGIEKADAISLGNRFEQNAIVFCAETEPAELILLK